MKEATTISPIANIARRRARNPYIFIRPNEIIKSLPFELGDELSARLPYIYIGAILLLVLMEKRYFKISKIYHKQLVGLQAIKLLIFLPFFLSAGIIRTILLILVADIVSYALHDLINFYYLAVPYGIHMFFIVLKNLKILNDISYGIVSFGTRYTVGWVHSSLCDLLIRMADSRKLFNASIQHPLVFCITLSAIIGFLFTSLSYYFCPTNDNYIKRPKARVKIYTDISEECSVISPIYTMDTASENSGVSRSGSSVSIF